MPMTARLRTMSPLFALKVMVLLFLPFFSLAQQKTVTGTVTDESGSPMSDISVSVKNGTAGTKTDEKGHFSISVAPGATLLFSSVNSEPFSLTVDSRDDYKVSLKSKVAAISDVVVVGYGRQKKVNLVGAVGVVNMDEKIISRAVPNVSSSLSGLVPGLSAVQNSGMAGNNGATLLIRGLGTSNNAAPLVVVDGMPDVDINRININDIESVSVLKDATSSAVYGSRAANGVILITTKTGKGMKKTAFNINTVNSIEKPVKAYHFMNDYARSLTLEQRRALVNTLPSNLPFRNGTIDQWMALSMVDPLRYPNTDWWNVIMQDGILQNYNVSAIGGDEKSNFFGSVGMRDEQGLQINNTYRQYNARFNLDYKLKSNMNTGFKFNGNWSKYVFALAEGFTDPDPSNTAGTDMQYAIAGITPYDPASGKFGGVMAYGEDPQAYNPYTVYVNMLTRQSRQEANVSAYWDWTPVKGLTAGLDYGLNYYNQFQVNANTPNQAFNFQTNSFGSRVYVGPNAPIVNNTNTGYKTLMNARLNYHTTIAKNHEISALAVYSEEYWYDRSQGASRNDRLFPSLTEVDAALTDVQSNSGSSSTEGLASYIGRVNYTAFGKYLLEGNIRVDGSSRFVSGDQWGYFPSVAAGWRFTEEDFIRKFTERFLTSGKLRVSYGSLGNNSGVGRYEKQFTLGGSNYIINNVVQRGFINSKLVRKSLTWETTTVLNVGLDLGFLNNRLTAELDYYDRVTTDLNRPSDLSLLMSGAFSPPKTNIGTMHNKGVEATISWRDKAGAFSYGVTLNASYNRNRLEKWSELLTRGFSTGGSLAFLNMPFDYVYAYQDAGIAQTWQDVYSHTPQGIQPGDIMRLDLNGDGQITGDDRKAYADIMNSRPTTFSSLNGYVAWKGFDLAFMIQATTGRKDFWLNAFNNVNFSAQRYAATWSHWTNPWSIDNRTALWPRLGGSGNNTAQTSFWLDDMSYVRFKNLQLGYTLPSFILRKIHASNLRVALSAENLATISSFRGLDPEKAGSNNNMYPIVKSYSVAVQLGF